MATSVTAEVADWIVGTSYEDIPALGVQRVKERIIDTIGVAYAGMAVSTGSILARWVEAQGARGTCTVLGAGFQTSPSYAGLVNASAGHALEFDDIAPFSGHYSNPMTASVLALGESLEASGRDVILGWMVGYEVIAQVSRVMMTPSGNSLLNRGWFNQGFAPAIGAAAAGARMYGFDREQTQMAMGHAASTMAGLLKNRGSDTKGFVAGNAVMHGIMAAELVSLGFTANHEIFDGEIGVARLLGLENGDASKILDGLGNWSMATAGSNLRLHACCGASHWSQDALQKILRAHPADPSQIAEVEVELPAFLMPNMPYDDPQTGLEGKYSLQYDMAAIALHGRAGLHQYTDELVRSPQSQDMMKRIAIKPINGLKLESRVVLKLKDGQHFEETVMRSHGNVADPLSREEVCGKFHECAESLISADRCERIISLCEGLDGLASIRELTRHLGALPTTSSLDRALTQ